MHVYAQVPFFEIEFVRIHNDMEDADPNDPIAVPAPTDSAVNLPQLKTSGSFLATNSTADRQTSRPTQASKVEIINFLTGVITPSKEKIVVPFFAGMIFRRFVRRR